MQDNNSAMATRQLCPPWTSDWATESQSHQICKTYTPWDNLCMAGFQISDNLTYNNFCKAAIANEYTL